MADFVEDTFTDTAGTNLSSHIGELGATWTIHTDVGGNGACVISDANRARCSTLGVATGATVYSASGTPSGADYNVTADYCCISTTANCGILIRYDPTTGNGYWLQYRIFHGWKLLIIAGDVAFAQVGSTYASEMTPGQTVTATVTVSGDDFTVDLAGDIIAPAAITGTDSTYSNAGKSGVMFTVADTNSTGVHLDNFVASEAGGGGGNVVFLITA